MSENLELGKLGEKIAREFLVAKGHRILAMNWRYGKDEIDIITLDGDMLVFVEVKTRQTDYYGDPESAVTKKKQDFLIRAANVYIEQKNAGQEVRFDVVSVLITPGGHSIHHIADAFYPRLKSR